MNNLGNQFLQRIWVDGLDKRLPVLVTLAALVLLMHSMANLTWKFVPLPDVVDQKINETRVGLVARPGAQETNQHLANKIAGWNLFGKYEVKKVAPEPVQKVETAPDTKLNLKLRGVFASPNPELARAIIADAKSQEDSYAIGSTVPGGAVVNQIFNDKVILEHNGRLETLRLPVEDAGPGMQGRRLSRGNTSSTRNFRRPGASPVPRNADNSALLRHYRDALLNDPQSVMGLVRAEPYEQNGRLKGYRIRPGKDRQLLRRFGLKSGDVVTAVNGIPMNNPIKALEVLRDLSSATQVTVELERRGVPQSFTFSIDN